VSTLAVKKNTEDPSRILVGYVLDVFAPMAAYFILDRLGAPPSIGLAIGCSVALASTARNTIQQRRIDRVGLLVVLEVAVSIGLIFWVRDQRILLSRPALYMEIAGFYLLATTFKGKPINFEGVRSMAARKDPARAMLVDHAWETSAAFRSMVRFSAISWALAFIADGVIRILVVYSVGLKEAWLLSNVPHLVIICLLIGFSALIGKRMAALVDGLNSSRASTNPDPESGISN
jgi:hypothetical protein